MKCPPPIQRDTERIAANGLWPIKGLLKSIVLKSGSNSRELRKQSVRHNLVELWRLATMECTQLQMETPAWVEALNTFHNDPYVSRYMRDVATYSLPPTEPALDGVICLHTHAKEFA